MNGPRKRAIFLDRDGVLNRAVVRDGKPYPPTSVEELDIPAELSILCGLAVGYPDPDFPGNTLRVGRERVDEHVRFLHD